MLRVMFICHGNICRSPMAEFVLKHMVELLQLQKEFFIASTSTSQEEIGNGVYPPVRKLLNSIGIDCSNKHARQITRQDIEDYDYLIVMDNNNLRNLSYLFSTLDKDKVFLLMDFTDDKREVADPWYTGEFKTTYNDVMKGCKAFLNYLIDKGEIKQDKSAVDDLDF